MNQSVPLRQCRDGDIRHAMTRIASKNVELIEHRFDKPIGGSGVRGVDIIVATLRDQDGVEGLGFSYVIGGGGAIVAQLADQQAETFLIGEPLDAPANHWARIRRSFNRTGDGPNLLGLAALDVALWDLSARRRNEPLYASLGGRSASVPIYASKGFAPNDAPEASAARAAAFLEEGYVGVKPRVNATTSDEGVLKAVREAVGDAPMVMVDANEKGDETTAPYLLEVAAAYGAAFVEEPLKAENVLGYRKLAAMEKRAPIAAGEHLQGLDRFQVMFADRMLTVIQPDLAMAGGLTPCLSIARLAAEHDVIVAPHFLPGLFVHLAGAFDGQLLLEDFPVIEALFEGWPARSGGTIAASTRPGHGLSLLPGSQR